MRLQQALGVCSCIFVTGGAIFARRMHGDVDEDLSGDDERLAQHGSAAARSFWAYVKDTLKSSPEGLVYIPYLTDESQQKAHAVFDEMDTNDDSVVESKEYAATVKETFNHGRNFTAPKKAVAVMIVGLRARFYPESTMEQVIRPLIQSGHSVHVYISLVDISKTTTIWSKQQTLAADIMQTADPIEVHRRVTELVRGSGGELVDFRLRQGREPIAEIPKEVKSMQLVQYIHDSRGTSVVRRYSATEDLWRIVEATEREHRFNYTHVLWARDDASWIWPLDFQHFESDPEGTDTLWTRACMEYGGVNDKVLVLGRNAAPKMLSAYSALLDQGAKLKKSYNSEEFLKNLADSSGVRSKSVDFRLLSAVDSMRPAEGDGKLCIKEAYACQTRGYPPGAPPMCPDPKRRRRR